MSKFITIGYGDQAGYDRTEASRRAVAHDHDAELLAGGALMGQVGTPVQVRNHDHEGVRIESGSFMRADLPVAGFMVIDAENLEEAIKLVAGSPCAVAHGVVEVWPLMIS